MLHGGLYADAHSLPRHVLPQILWQHLTVAHSGAVQATRLCVTSSNKKFAVKVSVTDGQARFYSAYGAVVDESGSHGW